MNPIALLALFICSLLLSLSGRAQAQTLTNVYWNPSALGGTGTWNTSTLNWSTNSAGGGTLIASPSTTNTVYNFSGTAGTVTESSSMTVGGINWLTSGYIWTSTGIRTLTGDTNTGVSSLIYITNNANLTITGSGFTFDALTMTGGTGATLTYSNAASAFTTNTWGTTSAKSGRTNFVNTIISGAGTVVLGTGGSSGFTQAGNITNNTSGMLVFTNGSSGNFTVSGAVSGAGALTLSNNSSGKIILVASNSYAGGTTIYSPSSSGYVSVNDSSAFGTGAITIAGTGTNYIRAAANNLNFANAVVINSGSTLQLAATNSGHRSTWSGAISGAGGLLYAFSDNGLYLTGTNSSFGGGVNVSSSGTLFVTALGMAGSNSSIGTNGTITISMSGTTGAAGLQWLGPSSETSDKTISLTATSANVAAGIKIYAGDAAAGGTNVTLTLNGNISSTGINNKVITLGAYNTNTLIVNGLIDQTAGYLNSLTVGVTGQSGTVVLGNTNNSYGGAVTMAAGASSTNILQVARIGNAGANSSLGTNGTINIGGSSSSGANILKYTGSGETSDKVINLAGTVGGASLDQSGTGNLKFTTAMTATGVGAKTLSLQGSTAGTGEIASSISDLGGNVISLTKSGSGLWTLSGNNSYSGNTTISAGTLVMNGTNTGAGAVIMNSSSTSVLRLGQTNAMANGVLAGASSAGSAGSVNLTVGGNHSVASYGSTANAGGYMSFTNSSGSAATLTFTAATNYVTVSSSTSGGRSVTNTSTNLTLVFNGAVDIGSSTTADVGFNGAGNITINGPIFNTNTGVRSLTKNGAGTLTLAGNNTYNGATTVSGGGLLVLSGSNSFNGLNISSGSVSIGNSNALGAGIISNTSSTGLIKIDGSVGTGNDWTLANNASAGLTTNDILSFAPGTGNTLRLSGAISGAGWLKVSAGGDLYVNNTNNSYSGGTEVGTGRILIADPLALGTGAVNFGTTTNSHLVATAGMQIANNITIGSSGSSGYTANIDTGANAVTVSSVIADRAGNAFGGKLVKLGSGSLTLSGANTYTGATTVSAGTLELAKVGGSALGSTASVSVATNAVLLLSQSDQVNNSASVSLSGGTIQRASGVSEVFGNLSLTTGSFLDFGTGTAGTMSFGTYTPSALLTVQNFFQGSTLTFSSDLTSTINNGSLFSFDNGFVSDWNVTTANTFTITAIPEPSTYVAAIGLIGLMLWPSRRRLLKDAKSILGLRAPARDRLRG